jgi:hypothetical protein
MNGVIRSWVCLNRRCGAVFDAWEAAPTCPACGNVRVDWVPGGGHTAGTAAACDAELRKLADCYGLADLNSARRDQAAKPIAAQKPVDPRAAPAMNFSGGFAAHVSPAQSRTSENPSGAQCVPTANNMNFKTTVGIGSRLAHSRTVPGVHTATAIEATHRPPR